MFGYDESSNRSRPSSLLRDVFPKPRASRSTPPSARFYFILAAVQAIVIWQNRDTIAGYLPMSWEVFLVYEHRWLLGVFFGIPITLLGMALGSVGQRIKAEYELSTVVPSRKEVAAEIADAVAAGMSAAVQFALFLRPFQTDGRLTFVNPNRRFVIPLLSAFYHEPLQLDLESFLADMVWPTYPLVSMGGPWIDVVGAGRIDAREEWQTLVEGLARQARIILFIPSDSLGCEWEVQMLKARGWLSKTVFVMPPGVETRRWEQAQCDWRDVGVALPDRDAFGLCFRVGDDGGVSVSSGLVGSGQGPLKRVLWPSPEN